MRDLDLTAGPSTSVNRRQMVAAIVIVSTVALPTGVFSQTRQIWSVNQAQQALVADQIRLVDVRSRGEWRETGVAQGAWPISLHEAGFQKRLFAARKLAKGRTIALICATGGRSGSVYRALRKANYDGFVDVSEGMLGSNLGPGWIATGLPVVSLDQALKALPDDLA